MKNANKKQIKYQIIDIIEKNNIKSYKELIKYITQIKSDDMMDYCATHTEHLSKFIKD